MSDDIVVTVETPEAPAEAIVEAESVIGQAIELAEIIDEARQEGAETAEVIEVTLTMLRADIAELKGLVEYLHDEIATLTAIEVADIIAEEPPAVVEEVPEPDDVVIEPEEVVEVNEPAPRIQKRKRNFI